MEKNLTTGSIWKNILYFALPYFLSYFLQTLYGLADLFIIGQFQGVDGITAVSNGSQIMHMLTVMIVGLAMGTTVMIGRAVGARKPEEASRIIGNTITLFLTLALVLMVVLVILVKPIVSLVGIPSEAVKGSIQYLTICFVGIPFITAYNIISSIFRGLGDSKSPMYFIAIACGVNIVLDYLFMGVFHMGPAGAALGTTLAQTVSVVIALWAVRKKPTGIRLKKQCFWPDRSIMKGLLQIGVPVAIQDGCIQIAFMVITVIANNRGLNDAAAVGIVEKVISGLFIVPSAMLATVSALAAQNIGANKHDRATQTLRCACVISCTYGLLLSIAVVCMPKAVVGLFTTDAVVMALGAQYLTSYIWDTIFAGVHFSFTGYFCAYGKSYIGFVHNILSMTLVRVPGAYLASKYFPDNLFPMGIAAPAGSFLSVLICLLAFYLTRRKRPL